MSRQSAIIMALAVLLAVALAWAFRVSRTPERASTSPREPARSSDSSSSAGAELRIVSLSPAITRTLVDFGLDGRLVGRSRFCEAVDPSIAVVGDLHNINYERLIRLRPTHVLVQKPRTGIDAELKRLASAHQWTLKGWALSSLSDIQRMLRELPAVCAGEAGAKSEALEARADALLARMRDVLGRGDMNPDAHDDTDRSPNEAPGEAAVEIWTGRTLIVNATDPVMVFGAETYLHDVLIALGGVNAIDEAGWVTLGIEDVVRLEPEAIIIVEPGAGSSMTFADIAGPLADVDVPAIRTGRVAILRHDDALLPCSAVVEVAEALRAILRDFALESTSFTGMSPWGACGTRASVLIQPGDRPRALL